MIPKPKKQTKTQKNALRMKCVELAKKIVRSQGFCDKCGRMDRQLHGAHVLSVRHHAICADLDNIMCLCAYCHKLSNDSWHEEPLENAEWFNNKYPGRYERLLEKSRQDSKYIDWMVVHESLKSLLQQVERGEINPYIYENSAGNEGTN